MRCVRAIWAISCLAGNFLQLYLSSYKYFQYGVGTNVIIEIPETFNLPSFTVCLHANKLIEWDRLTSDDKRRVLVREVWSQKVNKEVPVPVFSSLKDVKPEEVNKTLLSKIINSSSQAEIGRFFYAAEDLIVQEVTKNITKAFSITSSVGDEPDDIDCYSHKHGILTLDAINGTDFVERMSYRGSSGKNVTTCVRRRAFFHSARYKCFTFHYLAPCGDNIEYSIVRSKGGRMSAITLFHFERYNVSLEEVMISFTSPGEKFYPHATPSLTVEAKRHDLFNTYYNMYSRTLLPQPYATECRDYHLEGMSSRAECFESCVKVTSLKSWGDFHDIIAIYPEYQAIKEQYLNVTSKHRIPKVDPIADICSRQCRQKECHSEVYVPVIERVTRTHLDLNQVSITLSPNPVITTETIPQVSLIQYLTDVGSSLGIWFGLTIVGVMEVVARSFGKFVGRRKSRPQVLPQEELQNSVECRMHVEEGNEIVSNSVIEPRV